MFVSPIPQPSAVRPALSRHNFYRTMLLYFGRHFRLLLGSLDDRSWNTACRESKWTTGEMMVYLYLRLESIPAALNGIRMGSGYLNVSPWLKEYATYWRVKTSASTWNRQTLAPAFEQALERAIHALESVGEDEWWLAATVWGEPDTTVDALFRGQSECFARYARRIRAALS